MVAMSKRRVLFDAGAMLSNQKTGVGYYVSHLMTSLEQTHNADLQLTGYYFNFLNRHKDKVVGRLRFHKIVLIPGKLLSACRRLGFQPPLELFIRQKSDVIIFTNYVSLPLLRKRKILLVIYDLSFLDTPEFAQDTNLAFLKRFCPPSIRRADTIITISEFTKQRLLHHFPDITSDIVVTPIPPIVGATKKRRLSERLIKKGVKAKKYILYVGTMEPRKNLENLIAAYAGLDQATQQTHSLVLAGGRGWKDEGILAAVAYHQAKGLDIIMTGYVSEEEKNALYTNAACFVLPSHYEGFGMPIFEAMEYGIPVAISDIPVFHEVAGDAAIYFDKNAPEDIAHKITAVLHDSKLRDKLTKNGQARLKAFSWQDNAHKVYKSLI